MAKLTLNLDTETGAFETLVDGVAVPDVSTVCAERYAYLDYSTNKVVDKVHFDVTAFKKDDSGVMVQTRVMASELKDALAKYLQG